MSSSCRLIRHYIVASICFCNAMSAIESIGADAFDRMKLSKLRATRAALDVLREEWQEVQSSEIEFRDFRAQMHVHSFLSHDSVAPLEEIVEAARACNAQILMFNDHPSDEYDFFKDGHQGLRDGVLLIPGAEKGGFLLFPTRSIQEAREHTGEGGSGEEASSHGGGVEWFASPPYDQPQELADLVLQDGGMVFLSHLEERMDWEIQGITGNEIYNTHADVMGELQFLAALKNPVMMIGLLPALQQFPQETFGAILDYPEDYLRRWDQLCQMAPHTGIAANDAHHNQAFRILVTEDHQLAIEDALGKRVATLDPDKTPLVKPLIGNKQPGDRIMEMDLDPYERSFRHVSTHLLMRDLNKEEVWQALKAGRAYVSFEWLADPTGFRFEARQGDQSWPMGGQITLAGDQPASQRTGLNQPLIVSSVAPLPALYKLYRNGQVVKEGRGRMFDSEITQPGVYRVEAWLLVADELKPWILSNPIYVIQEQE